jgi:hypothetical protein
MATIITTDDTPTSTYSPRRFGSVDPVARGSAVDLEWGPIGPDSSHGDTAFTRPVFEDLMGREGHPDLQAVWAKSW